jgi:putative methionine-R-sulfoxide reductase with GAF domain/predicted transcriptional regulator
MTRKTSRVKGDIEAKLIFIKETLARLPTLEEVAVFATTTLNSIIPTDKIAVAVIEGNILRSVSTIGERVIMDLNLDWPSINARTVKTRRTQLVNDTSTDPDYFPGDGCDAVTMLSELCVPMIHRGRVLGTINLECRNPGRFSEEEARFAEAFASEVAEAMHRELGGTPASGGPRGPRRARNRSTMDNYHEILTAAHSGERVLNRILYRAAIPWKRGKEMADNLVAKGYLTKEKKSAARYIYRITEEGVEAMKNYDGIIENLYI